MLFGKAKVAARRSGGGTNDARPPFAGWYYQVEYEVLARGEGS